MLNHEMITQDELALYRDLSAKERDTVAAREALKRSILGKLEAGSPIESGPLQPLQVRSEAVRFSFDGLIKLLGIDRALELKQKTPPTVSVSLKVVEAA